MDTVNNKSKGRYWMLFIVSLIVCVAMMIIIPEWFWVTLPFVFTYLVQAMDVI